MVAQTGALLIFLGGATGAGWFGVSSSPEHRLVALALGIASLAMTPILVHGWR